MKYQSPSFSVPVSTAAPRANCTHGWVNQLGKCQWCGEKIVGRCEARYGSMRCDLPGGHSGFHSTRIGKYAVHHWTEIPSSGQ